MAALFQPLSIRGVQFRNRIVVSPMCQYSAEDGAPNEWHLVHLGSRAVGGAGLVIAEASGIVPEGRITPFDAGIYLDSHVEQWARIVRFIEAQGSVAGIQLAHAGRKASTDSPWHGGKGLTADQGGWVPVSSTSHAFSPTYISPSALDIDGIRRVVSEFKAAASRALAAGFKVVEIHGAHGYLLHQFYSPLVNDRTDEYGGSFENRTKIVLEVAQAIREVWPETLPLFLRISASDWKEGGWTIEDSVSLAKLVKPLGVDLIDCSSGGAVSDATIPLGPGYQVRFAAKVRSEANIATGAVGMITEPLQAEQILELGQADLVLLARELLRDPYWPRRAAKELGVELEPPAQYARAW